MLETFTQDCCRIRILTPPRREEKEIRDTPRGKQGRAIRDRIGYAPTQSLVGKVVQLVE